MTLKSMTLAASAILALAVAGPALSADVKSMATDVVKDQALDAAKGQATDTLKGKPDAVLPKTNAIPGATVPATGTVDPTKKMLKDATGGKVENPLGTAPGDAPAKKGTHGPAGAGAAKKATGDAAGAGAAKKATGGATDTVNDLVKDQATKAVEDKATGALKGMVK